MKYFEVEFTISPYSSDASDVLAAMAGEAGFNIEFLPSQYWLKTYNVDGRLGRLPRYATSQTITRPNAEKPRQFKGFKTYDDRGTNRFIDPLPIETGHKITLATDQPKATAQLMRIMSDGFSEQAYQGEIKTWGQNEGTIAGNTQYVIFGSSFKNIVTK